MSSRGTLKCSDFFGALRGMLKPLLAGNSLDLIFEAAPDLPTLYMDEGKISQVLRNLISNALKFTRKGHIRVSADLESGGWIVFRVADTGIGIALRIRADLRGVRPNRGRVQSQVKGTGLGLPLSRKLTDAFGGHAFGRERSGKGFDVHCARAGVASVGRSRADPHPRIANANWRTPYIVC